MYVNFFNTILRFVKRNKVFTAINVLGLSLALAVSFIILLYVINELSYNQFFSNRDTIYRITFFDKEFDSNRVGTPFLMAPILKESFPYIDKVARTRSVLSFKIKSNDEWIDIKESIASEPDVFEMFDINIKGADKTCLTDLSTIVLSQNLANKLFLNTNPLGQQLVCLINGEKKSLIVKGIFKNLPVNSSLQPDCFINIRWTIDNINKAYEPYGIAKVEENWDFSFWNTWIQLKIGADAQLCIDQLQNTEFGGRDDRVYSAQSLKDAYLGSDYLEGAGRNGELKTIRILLSIAILILIAASFNYIILSTAISVNRSKEIGVRKTAGATIVNIRTQILSESILLAFMSLPLAIIFAASFMPYAENLFHKELSIIGNNVSLYIAAYLGITLLIGLASGIYLSFYLSKLNTIEMFRNRTITSNRSSMRYALIVVQFVIFSVLVASALIMQAQYKFAVKREQGYLKEDIIVVNLGKDFKNYTAFLNTIKSNPNVISAGGTMFPLPMVAQMSSVYKHFKDETINVEIEGMAVDYGFIETMGLEIIKGRSFSESFGNDLKNSTILNEKAVADLGIDNPVGKKIGNKTIIGIVKDFNLHSVHNNIPPLSIEIVDVYLRYIAIRYKSGGLQSLLPLLKMEWDKLNDERAFDYSTIDDITQSIYKDEQNLSSIISLFAFLVSIITSLGLYGLILFVSQQRTKEIGIRKVLGSSRYEIIISFLKRNILLIVVSTIVSIPITIVAMNEWLSNFYYRIDIPWWVFIMSLTSLILIVMTAIGYHAYRASGLNPVEALRYE